MDYSKLRLQIAPFLGRLKFSEYLNSLNLQGVAVEIGTHRGDFAEPFLAQWKGHKLYCIDPWETLLGYEYQAQILQEAWGTDGNRDHDRDFTINRLKKFGDRVIITPKVSTEAVESFKDNSVDFVFVDGDHSLEAVDFDVRNWWRKVKVGGILAGHDYLDYDGWSRNIQTVVHRFAIENGIPLYVVAEEHQLPWSYYFVKNK